MKRVRARSSVVSAPTPDVLAERQETHQGRRPLVLALAVIIALLVIIGFLVLIPTGEPAPVPIQSAPTYSPVGDSGIPAPVVTATPGVGSVEFAWAFAAALSTDTYRAQVGPTPADAQIADPVTVQKATYAVKVANGSTICLVATVVRAGRTSPASTAVCAMAL